MRPPVGIRTPPALAAWMCLAMEMGAACGASGSHQAAASSGAREEAIGGGPSQPLEITMSTGAISPDGQPHPGTIHYVDQRNGREWDVNAADSPQTIAWVRVNDVWEPVLRVALAGDAGRAEITKFGRNGAFLETTVMTGRPSRHR